jgi:hypothetical protein
MPIPVTRVTQSQMVSLRTQQRLSKCLAEDDSRHSMRLCRCYAGMASPTRCAVISPINCADAPAGGRNPASRQSDQNGGAQRT